MLYLVIALVLLGLFCAILGYCSYRRGGDDKVVVAKGDCTSCVGDDASCEQICALKAAVKPIEYFDDEELDGFKGRPSDAYSDEETAQFAEVLETLRSEEVRQWGRSLMLRGINMPDALKDEYIALAQRQ